MPAAAVIPAPIACTKVVAVKKLVVVFLGAAGTLRGTRFALFLGRRRAGGSFRSRFRRSSFTVRKFKCLKQPFWLKTLAWNNEIGLACYFVGCVCR